MSVHYHVQSGLAGYGPDADENTPTFETLADALDYARDELSTYVDMAHQDAHALAESGDFESAWLEILRIESLELLYANLDPKRASAPLYAGDAAAYAALQESQAQDFPHDVSSNARLYLWECAEPECVQVEPDAHDGYVNEPAYGAPIVSLDNKVIGTAESVPAAFRILARAMVDGNYFPNVWHINERGNTTLVSLDLETGSYSFTETSYV